MKKLEIVKVGGAVVEDTAALSVFLDGFCSSQGLKILVHGGGRSATAFAGKLGLEVKMVEGRRITDASMLEVVTMVYGGLVNKNIVAQLQARGVDALGLTGADLASVRAVKRPAGEIDYGFVGDVTGVAADSIAKLLEDGIVPVFAPLSFDGTTLLNTNADTIAASIASAMAGSYEVSLRYCFEKEGVLDTEGRVIPRINAAAFARMKSCGTVSGGMIPKIENALASISEGVNEVYIGSTLICA